MIEDMSLLTAEQSLLKKITELNVFNWKQDPDDPYSGISWDTETIYQEIQKGLTSSALDLSSLHDLKEAKKDFYTWSTCESSSRFLTKLFYPLKDPTPTQKQLGDLACCAIMETDKYRMYAQCIESFNLLEDSSIQKHALLNRISRIVHLRALIFYAPGAWDIILQQALREDNISIDLYHAALWADNEAQKDFLSSAKLSLRLHFIELDTLSKNQRYEWISSYLKIFRKNIIPESQTKLVLCPSEAYFLVPFNNNSVRRLKILLEKHFEASI